MRSSDVNVEATQHPVSCLGSGSDFINLNRSVELSSAWLTHPGSQRGETSAFRKVASSLCYLIKDLFYLGLTRHLSVLQATQDSCFRWQVLSRHSWSFKEPGAGTALPGEHGWFPHRSSS